LVAQSIEHFAYHAFRRALLEFHRRGRGVVGADEAIIISPSRLHRGGFGAQHGVDPTELPAHFPRAFEEHRRMREREAAEREALEAAMHGAADPDDDATDDDDRKEKKKKKHKHKDKK